MWFYRILSNLKQGIKALFVVVVVVVVVLGKFLSYFMGLVTQSSFSPVFPPLSCLFSCRSTFIVNIYYLAVMRSLL